MPTSWPRRARATARLTLTEDLPTPPFPRGKAEYRRGAVGTLNGLGPPLLVTQPLTARTALTTVGMPRSCRGRPLAGPHLVPDPVQLGLGHHRQIHCNIVDSGERS